MDNQELELLQSIAGGVKELKGRLTNMESDIKDMKNRQTNMENDIKDVKLRLTTVENEVKDVKFEVVKTNILIENDVWPAIKVLKEGYDGQRDILKEVKNTVDEMVPVVLALDIMHIEEAKTKRIKIKKIKK